MTHAIPLEPSVPGGMDILHALAAGVKIELEDGLRRRWRARRCGYEFLPDEIDDSDLEWTLESGCARRENGRLALSTLGRATSAMFTASVLSMTLHSLEIDLTDSDPSISTLVKSVRNVVGNLASFDLSFCVAQVILKMRFGDAWVSQHIGSLSACQFLRVSSETDVIGMTRTIRLAEMVANLKSHAGVGECLQRLAKGEIEPTYAELEVAKLLSVSGIPFHFVERTFRKGFDYDVELTIDETKVCGETKCKVEITDFSESTVISALKTAASQLPSDAPGFIFLKIPQSWGGVSEESRGIRQAIEAFFKLGTGRVVSVKVFSSGMFDDGHGVAAPVVCAEFQNPRGRFHNPGGWDIFETADALPAQWVQLSKECANE